MGWEDYHLHEFVVVDPKSEALTRIGILMRTRRTPSNAWRAGVCRSRST
jgi:hypothetical protein